MGMAQHLLRRMSCAALLAGTAVLAACAPTNFNHPGQVSRPDVYNQAFPYYAELCAVSQISKKPGFGADISGGAGGHAVMFLGGVCLDRKAGYPVLTECDATRTADRPDGVGFSMNSHYSNANWTGAEGSAFYFDGTLAPGQGLTRAGYVATQDEAKRRGIYDGVIFHKEVFNGKPANMSAVDWKYEMSVGTDYATTLGRARFCARLPVTGPQMRKIMDFLNARNAVYRNGPKTYDSNVLQDNCNHLTHNALAAAGFWSEWPINRFVMLAALSFPVPKNELVNLIHRTDAVPVEKIQAIFNDRLTYQTFMQYDWLADEPGVLLESEPVHTPNEVYNTSLSLIFYDDPVLGSYHRNFAHYLKNAHYYDLRTNLEYFSGRYARILQERQPLSWWQAHHPSLARASGPFPAFYQRYYDYIAAQQAKVQQALADLRNTEAPQGR